MLRRYLASKTVSLLNMKSTMMVMNREVQQLFFNLMFLCQYPHKLTYHPFTGTFHTFGAPVNQLIDHLRNQHTRTTFPTIPGLNSM